MKPVRNENQNLVIDLLRRYKVMSQNGTVAHLQETEFLQLVEYFVSRNETVEALELIDHAIAQYSTNSSFYYKKAILLKSLDLYNDAIQQLERAQIYNPNNVDTTLLLAELKAQIEDYDAALDILGDLKNYVDEDQHYLIHYTESIIFENLGDYTSMYTSLKKSILANSTYAPALEKMWYAVELTHNFKDSIKLHTYLTDKDPYSYRAWFNLGHAFNFMGKFDDAIEAFDFAYTINEKFEFAYRDCAEVCIETGKYEKALKCFRDLLSHVYPDAHLLSRIGYCYFKINDFDSAQTFFVRALKENQKDHETIYLLGECFIHFKVWDKAMKCYKAAIKEESRREEYYVGLAKAYHGLGNDVDALLCYQKSVDIAPDMAAYWIQYALFLVSVNQGEKAINILEEAIDYVGEVDIAYCKVECLYKMGKVHEAIYILGDALEVDFLGHELLLQRIPELKDNEAVQSLINAFNIH
jgi:tetratricopeptide (TPR) repeat protein